MRAKPKKEKQHKMRKKEKKKKINIESNFRAYRKKPLG